MNIFANTVVTLTFQLYDGEGTLLEETPALRERVAPAPADRKQPP